MKTGFFIFGMVMQCSLFPTAQSVNFPDLKARSITQLNNTPVACNEIDWAVWSSISGRNSSGIISSQGENIDVTINSNLDLESAAQVTRPEAFKRFKAPISTTSVARTSWSRGPGGKITICFSKPVKEPVLLLASLGSFKEKIQTTITFSEPYVVTYDGGGMRHDNNVAITGREGYALLKFPGDIKCITINSSTFENFTDLTFGIPVCPEGLKKPKPDAIAPEPIPESAPVIAAVPEPAPKPVPPPAPKPVEPKPAPPVVAAIPGPPKTAPVIPKPESPKPAPVLAAVPEPAPKPSPPAPKPVEPKPAPPVIAAIPEPPKTAPVIPKPESPKPAPVLAAVTEPAPKPVPPAPKPVEPKPAPPVVAAIPEPKPAPVIPKPEPPKPAPVLAVVPPVSKPAEPKPVPPVVAAMPEPPKPAPVIPKPEPPKPAPVLAAVPEPAPKPVPPAPKPVEPKPAPPVVAAIPEPPKPAPVIPKPEPPKPAPVLAVVPPVSKPAEPKPVPPVVAAMPEPPKPAPVIPKPEPPKPAPVLAAVTEPAPKPSPVTTPPSELISKADIGIPEARPKIQASVPEDAPMLIPIATKSDPVIAERPAPKPVIAVPKPVIAPKPVPKVIPSPPSLPVLAVAKPAPQPIPPPKPASALKENQLKVEIWDYSGMDYDSVSLKLNGRQVGANAIQLNLQKKNGSPESTYVLDLQPGGNNTLEIVATSEGVQPYTTIALLIMYEDKPRKLLFSLKAKESTLIHL